jgi:hypothetical protein
MVETAFPTGISSFGVPVIGSGQLPITGTNNNYWFVSSVYGSSGNVGNDASQPFAALMNALTVASSGDIIVLLPNHAETVSTAGGITTGTTAGLTVIGQGEGSNRPTFTFSATAATFTVTSASFSISNILCTNSIDQVVSPFVISAADCTLGLPGEPVEWHDAASNKEALRLVLTTASASRFNANIIYYGFTAGSHGVNAVRLVGVATANINIQYYGVLTTAVVEFFTTACSNVTVTGEMYVSGVTNFTKDVVDTITGSTWFANIYDGAYGGLVSGGSASALAASSSASISGNVTTINTNVATLNNNAEKSAITAAAVISNGLTLFTVTGPVEIMAIGSICATANGATASTLQYSSTGTLGSTTQTISAASASLASATAGTTVLGILTALSTPPTVNANAAGLISTGPSSIMVPAGSITAVVGVGSTTGTWQHFIRYKPLAPSAAVTNAF